MSLPARSMPALRYLRKHPRFAIGDAGAARFGGETFVIGDISSAGMRLIVSAALALEKGERRVFELEIRHPRDEDDHKVWSIPTVCAWRAETDAGFSFEIPEGTRRDIERMLARIFATGAVKIVNASE